MKLVFKVAATSFMALMCHLVLLVHLNVQTYGDVLTLVVVFISELMWLKLMSNLIKGRVYENKSNIRITT